MLIEMNLAVGEVTLGCGLASALFNTTAASRRTEAIFTGCERRQGEAETQ